MLRYGSRRIRKHLTMRMPKKINNKITKTNVVFCSRDMLESDDTFPRGTRGEGTGCPPSIVQGNWSTGSPRFLLFHHQSAEIMVVAPWRGWIWLNKHLIHFLVEQLQVVTSLFSFHSSRPSCVKAVDSGGCKQLVAHPRSKAVVSGLETSHQNPRIKGASSSCVRHH